MWFIRFELQFLNNKKLDPKIDLNDSLNLN